MKNISDKEGGFFLLILGVLSIFTKRGEFGWVFIILGIFVLVVTFFKDNKIKRDPVRYVYEEQKRNGADDLSALYSALSTNDRWSDLYKYMNELEKEKNLIQIYEPQNDILYQVCGMRDTIADNEYKKHTNRIHELEKIIEEERKKYGI